MELTSGGNTDSGATATGSFEGLSWAEPAADASPASDPSTQTTTPAGAATPPAASEASPQQDAREPFIPRARFDEVNTRMNKAEQDLQAWKQYEWVRQLPATDFQEAINFYAQTKGDPIAMITELVNRTAADPTHGQTLRSLMARQLAAGRGQQQDAEPGPDLPLQLEDGRTVHLYSAEQQAKREAWLQRQWLGQVDQKISPLQQSHEQQQKAQKLAEEQAQAGRFAGDFFTSLQKLPHFSEHQAAIAEKLRGAQMQSDHPAEVKSAAYQAYLDVLQEKVLPSLSSTAQAKLLDSLQTKAAASTGVNPASAAPSTPKRVRSFEELGADAWK